MYRRSYPSNPWLLDFIVHQKRGRSATTLHVLKPLPAVPCPDGCKMMLVADGELTLKAQFAADSLEKLEDSEDEETWERALIKLKDWDMRLLLRETKEKSEYIIDINRFVIWNNEKHLTSKNTMVPCRSNPQIQETIARIWTENQLSNQSVTDPPKDSDLSLTSIPLSILIEQMAKDDDQSSSEEEEQQQQSLPKIYKMPNAGLMPASLENLENLQRYFETENVKDFLISPEDAKTLAAIVEWKDDYRVPENPSGKSGSEKSGSENPVPVLAATSTLKHQGKSAKVSEEAIVVPPPASIERPDPQEGVAAPIRSNTEAEEEEIRLLNLSRVSNKQGKCPPIKEKSSKDSSKDSLRGVPPPCPGTSAETGSASGTRKASKYSSRGVPPPCPGTSAETGSASSTSKASKYSSRGVPPPCPGTSAETGSASSTSKASKDSSRGVPPPCPGTSAETGPAIGISKASKDSSRGVPPPCPGTSAETGSASGTSKASQLNKDSTETETSFEIPLSGKVASNYNPNNRSKSTSEELLHCSLLDSSQETNSEKEARWNHLDLSSIESEKLFELAPRASKAQNKAQNDAQIKTQSKAQREDKGTQTSKRVKLTHVSESTCDPRSQDSQGRLLNQPQLKQNPGSKSLTLEMISESSSLELIKSVPQGECATNKVRAVNSRENLPVLNSLVETTLSPMKKMNLFPKHIVSSDSEEEEEEAAQPTRIYATSQDLFPKHAACASLLSHHLTLENNFNNVRLPKENMDAINTYWSLSHDKKP